jgi:hypothetical protein
MKKIFLQSNCGWMYLWDSWLFLSDDLFLVSIDHRVLTFPYISNVGEARCIQEQLWCYILK